MWMAVPPPVRAGRDPSGAQPYQHPEPLSGVRGPPKSPAKIQPLVHDVLRNRSLSPERVIPHRKLRHRVGERWASGQFSG